VDQAHATQRPSQERFLLGRWVEAVAEGSLHGLILQDRRDSASRRASVAIPPRPEARGFSRGF
jgi:hypothetical protein